MDQEEKQPEQDPVKKTPTTPANNLVWYLVAAAVVTLLVVGFWPVKGRLEIAFSDLVRLVEQGSPHRNPKAAINVRIEKDGKATTVRYSDLHGVRIGRSEIIGKVTRQTVEPADLRDDEPQKDVSFHTARFGSENDSQYLSDLFKKNGFFDRPGDNVSGEPVPSGWRSQIPLLVITVVFIVLFIVMMRRLGGAGGAMAFGRSRGRLIAQEEVGVSFKDVAGVDEAVEELREVVEFLKTPDKFRVLGGRV
ncbi:MAG TPA: hypothetical protein VJL29_15580, partial [Thermoguttaceae bacterium]|nr:hypothetical protein [Thermoguttaceae bacterium]